jgi:hypothetical protein
MEVRGSDFHNENHGESIEATFIDYSHNDIPAFCIFSENKNIFCQQLKLNQN